jgi:signal transduction histidine kinase
VKLGLPGESAGLAKSLAWITGLRLAFFTLLLGGTAFLYLGRGLLADTFSLKLVLGVIGFAYGIGAGYAFLLRRGKNLELLAAAQVALDQITWTAIVYVTGGATSGATAFYALSCLTGAVLIGTRGALFGAVIGLSLYVLLCVGFAVGVVVPPPDQSTAAYLVTFGDLVYPLLLNALGISTVAVLAGFLASRLRVAGGALALANQRAADAERLAVLGRIAAGLAHEIRNPLGSIRGSIEMLSESPGISGDDRRLCDIVQRESSRLSQLVDDMMDLAKPRTPRPERVDVAEIARDVVALANRSDRSASGDVAVVYKGPEGAAFGRCDGAQMRQVLWNLVRNAVQASGSGEEVQVRVRDTKAKIELDVVDRGPGISEALRERIFESFFTTRTNGAGIGLAVVKRIIDEHEPYGVKMDIVSSEAGRGATFRIELVSP